MSYVLVVNSGDVKNENGEVAAVLDETGLIDENVVIVDCVVAVDEDCVVVVIASGEAVEVDDGSGVNFSDVAEVARSSGVDDSDMAEDVGPSVTVVVGSAVGSDVTEVA